MVTLVVIDMQPRFGGSQRKWMIRNVSTEIKAAVKAGRRIIFVEFPGIYGDPILNATDKRLTKLVAGYDNTFTVQKHKQDGSKEVVRLLRKLAGRTVIREEIRVVGVNTGACVAETVNGMARKMSKASIVLVGKACNEGWSTNSGSGQSRPGNGGLGTISAKPNVTILKVQPKAKTAAA